MDKEKLRDIIVSVIGCDRNSQVTNDLIDAILELEDSADLTAAYMCGFEKGKDSREKEIALLRNALKGYKMSQQIIDKDKEIVELRNVAKSVSQISEKQMYEIAELKKCNAELERLLAHILPKDWDKKDTDYLVKSEEYERVKQEHDKYKDEIENSVAQIEQVEFERDRYLSALEKIISACKDCALTDNLNVSWIKGVCEQALSQTECSDKGEISDGYHTFNELYDHRCLLWINMCLMTPDTSYLIKEHLDGWFLLGNETPYGQISYHCPNKYLPLVKVIKQKIIKYDGHTSKGVIERLKQLAEHMNGTGTRGAE